MCQPVFRIADGERQSSGRNVLGSSLRGYRSDGGGIVNGSNRQQKSGRGCRDPIAYRERNGCCTTYAGGRRNRHGPVLSRPATLIFATGTRGRLLDEGSQSKTLVIIGIINLKANRRRCCAFGRGLIANGSYRWRIVSSCHRNLKGNRGGLNTVANGEGNRRCSSLIRCRRHGYAPADITAGHEHICIRYQCFVAGTGCNSQRCCRGFRITDSEG